MKTLPHNGLWGTQPEIQISSQPAGHPAGKVAVSSGGGNISMDCSCIWRNRFRKGFNEWCHAVWTHSEVFAVYLLSKCKNGRHSGICFIPPFRPSYATSYCDFDNKKAAGLFWSSAMYMNFVCSVIKEYGTWNQMILSGFKSSLSIMGWIKAVFSIAFIAHTFLPASLLDAPQW